MKWRRGSSPLLEDPGVTGGKTHVKTSAERCSPVPTAQLASGLWLLPLGCMQGRWQRSEVPLPVASLLCFLLPSHLYLWAGGWAPVQRVGWASVSWTEPGTEERAEAYWFTSWPAKTPRTAAPHSCTWCRRWRKAAQQEGPAAPPAVCTAGGSSQIPHWDAGWLPVAPPLTPCPGPSSAGIGRNWHWLHRHQHLLPAALRHGRGGHPEDHMPAPSGQGQLRWDPWGAGERERATERA